VCAPAAQSLLTALLCQSAPESEHCTSDQPPATTLTSTDPCKAVCSRSSPRAFEEVPEEPPEQPEDPGDPGDDGGDDEPDPDAADPIPNPDPNAEADGEAQVDWLLVALDWLTDNATGGGKPAT
jgi:hypothetical protein